MKTGPDREGQARRAGMLAVAAAILYLAALVPSLYGEGGPLAQESLAFGLLRSLPFALAAVALFQTRLRVFGSGMLVGTALGALRFVLLNLTVAFTELGVGIGVVLLTVAELAALIGAWMAGRLLLADGGRPSAPSNLHFAALAGVGSLIYAGGETVPKVTIEVAPGIVGVSDTAFTDFGLATIWTLLGMVIIVALPVLGAMMPEVRAGAGLVAGSTLILIAEVASGLSVVAEDQFHMNIGLVVQLVGVGLLLVALFVITPFGRRVSGA